MIAFSELQSYMLYCGSILLATAFASMAQNIKYCKKGKRVVNPYFWVLSFLCLFIPVAFRGYGVDHGSYLSAYYEVSPYGWGYFKTYTGFPEPLYATVNIIAGYLGDFQYVYIIAGFISIFFTYKAFARKVNETNLGMCVWMFSTLFYLNLFGLTRMGIAVGIITYAYRYIEESNFKMYSVYVIFAALFHYSAIIMFPLYYVFKSNYFDTSTKGSIKKSWLSLGVVVTTFAIAGYLMSKFQNIPWMWRYAQYFEGTSIDVIKNIGGQYPLILLVIIFGSRINRKEKYGSLYISMFITMILFVVGSIFVSFMRLTYYLYPATYYLYAYVTKCIDNPKKKIIYNYAMFIIMTMWFLYRFTSILWGPYLIPYHLNIP
ncbi:EpsG family protein [Clostridium tagluense]|uniref:EpsG family protein n=1 Tax=Clostridium tagluense TaxID=360422 RepID=UPI001CF4450F|nr:EpsG family protein [Clostridium tagluense]MCB2296779.1 EpsG family protein [Clostridium tagluense]